VSPLPCPIGTYSDTEQNDDITDCLPCSIGRYCDDMGLTLADLVNKECFEGFICLGGSDIPNPKDGVKGQLCDPGHYCLQGTLAMAQCPAGSYEPRYGNSDSSCQDCPKGWFCPIGSTKPTICPILSYCPVRSVAPLLCPDGTYNDVETGLEKSNQCKECPTGQFCQGGAIVGPCSAGYYCDTGATSATDSAKECPVGFYCPNTPDPYPIRCPDNTIREIPGAKVIGDCAVCPNGYYCLSGTNTKVACPRGFYCPAGNPLKAIPCPVGTYREEELGFASGDCLTCPAGYFCYEKGITSKNNYLC